jgi:HSP20 family molecular chaperone IbpA
MSTDEQSHAEQITEGSAHMPDKDDQIRERVEGMTSRTIFTPKVDLYETPEAITLLADVPGVDENAIDMVLDDNVLTIHAFGSVEKPEGFSLIHSEWETGDYQRVLTLSDDIDRNGIKAAIRNGVLRLTLPKRAQSRTRKITVMAE